MPNRKILWIINLILFILGLVLAYRGWQATRHTRILVEWTTASELDTVGYNLYRSEDPAKMGTRVNPELIPASPDPLTGGSYEFEDRNVLAGVSYYYTLEEVESSGATNRAGIIEVTAKPEGWWQIGLAGLLFGVVIVGAIKLVEAYRTNTS